MFGNKIVHYGGSGGGVRRGLIWTNSDVTPQPVYEKLYTPYASDYIPWFTGRNNIGESSMWYDYQVVTIENAVEDGYYKFGNVNQYGYHFSTRSDSSDYTKIVSDGSSNIYHRSWKYLGSYTYRQDLRNQIPYRLVGNVCLYCKEETEGIRTEEELREILNEMRSRVTQPSSSILVPTDGYGSGFRAYNGVPFPNVFNVDNEEYLNTWGSLDTMGIDDITLDKGRMFYSDFIRGNIQINTKEDSNGSPQLYLRAINMVSPRKLSTSSDEVVLDQITRHRINTQPEPYGWHVSANATPTALDVSSFVPDMSQITGRGYFLLSMDPGLHYVPLNIYYLTSTRDYATYGLVFNGFLSFYENKRIVNA